MKCPIVTVAIPVFNCEKYISKSVASVLNQTFKDFELIIYDDGSKDKTLQLIKEIKDPRIKIYRDGQNKGIAVRLNQMIDLAQGKYFVRMDGDDIMFPDRLEKQLSYLNNSQQIDVLGSTAIIIDESDRVIGRRSVAIPANPDALYFNSRFIHPTVIGKTEWFKKWKYDNNMSGCEDMELWIRSGKYSVFADYPEPLLFYRESLKLRLRTYCRRHKVYCSFIIKQRNNLKLNTFLLVLMKNVLTVCIAMLAHCLNMDEKFILRRNIFLSEKEKEKYSSLLIEAKLRN